MACALYNSRQTGNPVWFWHREYIPAHRKLSRCKRCRYDLAGLDECQVCPECGIDSPSRSEILRRGVRQWSPSRLAMIPIFAAASLLLGPCSLLHWNVLWALSRWGPRPHFASLPADYEAFWLVWLTLWSILLAQICPWKMSLRQIMLISFGGVAGLLITNGFLIQWIWMLDDRNYLRCPRYRRYCSMWLVNPYLPIIGTSIGLLLASRIKIVLGKDEFERVKSPNT